MRTLNKKEREIVAQALELLSSRPNELPLLAQRDQARELATKFRKKETMKKVTVTNFGRPEYLDGARMQYAVGNNSKGTFAYFAKAIHAKVFAEVISETVYLRNSAAKQRPIKPHEGRRIK